MADSNRTQLRYVSEATWGTTPASALKDARFTGEDLRFNIATIQSNEIRSDRQITDLIQTSFSANGGFQFELSYGAFDEFFEGALFGSFSAAVNISATDISASSVDNSFNSTVTDFTTKNISVGQWIKVSGFSPNNANNGYHRVVSVATNKIVVSGATLVNDTAGDTIVIAGSMLRNGTTEKSFTLEKEFSDVAQFLAYTGMMVNTLDLQIAAQQIITGNLQFMGKLGTIAGATVGTGPATAAPTNPVMNAGAHVGSIREGGTEVSASAYVQSLSVNVNNGLRDKPAVGVIGNVDIGVGSCVVTGSLTAYFQNEALYEKFIDNSASSVDFRVSDANGKSYIATLPKIKFSNGDIVARGTNQDVMVELQYQALRDPVTGCTIQLDKFGTV